MLIDDSFLDIIQDQAKLSSRLRQNYNLHESLEEKSQKLINVLEPGTKFQIHRHCNNIACVFIIRGSIDYIFYDDLGHEKERFHLNPKEGCYGVKIPAGTWHSMVVNESSAILEVKDGPYIPLSSEDIL